MSAPSTTNYRVGGSGQLLALDLKDAAGAGTPATKVQAGNDTQMILINAPGSPGTAVAGTYTLTFTDQTGNSQTTASIPYTPVAPAKGGLFTFSTVAGHAYRLGIYWVKNSSFVANALCEVINESGVIVATHNFNEQATSPNSFTASVGPAYGNASFPWDTIVDGYMATGTTLSIRITGDNSNIGVQFAIDAVMVQDKTSGTSTAYDQSDPTHFTTYGSPTTQVNLSYVNGDYIHWQPGSGMGGVFSCDPKAVVSALQALSNVLPGSITCTAADGNQAMPLTVSFAGSMGGVAQTLMAATSPYVSVGSHVPGGNVPIALVDGVSVPVRNWVLVGNSVVGMLYQASPATITLKTRGGNFQSTGSWTKTSVSGSVSDLVFSSSSAGAVAYFPGQALTEGQWQVAITWQASSSLSATSQFLVLDSSGATLGTFVVDQTVAPSDYFDGGVGYKILGSFLVAGLNIGLTVAANTVGSTKAVAIDAAQLVRTTADSSQSISQGQNVTLSIPDGFFTVATGSVPGVSAAAVTNNSGGSMLPVIKVEPKALKVGQNISGTTYYDDCQMFSNFAARIGGPLGAAWNSDGFPTILASSTLNAVIVTEPSPNLIGNGKGMLNAPVGLWTLIWTGSASDNVQLGGSGGPLADLSQYRNITGSSRNIRVYNIQANAGEYAPNVQLIITSSAKNTADPTGKQYLCGLTKLEIYPPSPSDKTGQTTWGINETPPESHPSFLYKTQGMKCRRFMDAMRTNSAPFGEITDIRPNTATFRGDGVRPANSTVLSCVPYIPSSPIDVPTHAKILVTTATPHGLVTWSQFAISGVGSAMFSDGLTRNLTNYGYAEVLTSTTFIWHYPVTLPTGTVMTGSTSGGTVSAKYGTSLSLKDITDLSNQDNTDAWFCVPITASDACIDAIADWFAANLNPGLKVYLEYQNETWNNIFQATQVLYILNWRLNGIGSDNTESYAKGAINAHNRWAARYALAGRPATDLVRTFCGWQVDTTRTKSICNYVTKYGGTIDLFAHGVYWDTIGTWPANLYTTPGQCIDILEVNLLNTAQFMGSNGISHRSVLDANGFPGALLGCYEASPEALLPGPEYGSTGTTQGPYLHIGSNAFLANLFYRQQAVRRHPGMYGCQQFVCQHLNDEGVTLMNDYYDYGSSAQFAWSSSEWFDQQRGTGNRTLDALNISDPQAMTYTNGSPLAGSGVLAEKAGALYDWNTLGSTVITPPPTGHRNNTLLVLSRPRNLFRTMR